MIGVLSGKKTTVTAAMGVIGALAAMAVGDLSAFEGIGAIFNCLMVVFVRHDLLSK